MQEKLTTHIGQQVPQGLAEQGSNWLQLVHPFQPYAFLPSSAFHPCMLRNVATLRIWIILGGGKHYRQTTEADFCGAL